MRLLILLLLVLTTPPANNNNRIIIVFLPPGWSLSYSILTGITSSAPFSGNGHFCLQMTMHSLLSYSASCSRESDCVPLSLLHGHRPVALLNQCGLRFKSWGHPVTVWFWESLNCWAALALKVCTAFGSQRHSAELSMNYLLKREKKSNILAICYKTLPCVSSHWFWKHICLCRYLCFQTPSPESCLVTSILHHLPTPLHTHTSPLRGEGAILALLLGIEATVRVFAGGDDWQGQDTASIPGAPPILTAWLHIPPDPRLFLLSVHVPVPSISTLVTSLCVVSKVSLI